MLKLFNLVETFGITDFSVLSYKLVIRYMLMTFTYKTSAELYVIPQKLACSVCGFNLYLVIFTFYTYNSRSGKGFYFFYVYFAVARYSDDIYAVTVYAVLA